MPRISSQTAFGALPFSSPSTKIPAPPQPPLYSTNADYASLLNVPTVLLLVGEQRYRSMSTRACLLPTHDFSLRI